MGIGQISRFVSFRSGALLVVASFWFLGVAKQDALGAGVAGGGRGAVELFAPGGGEVMPGLAPAVLRTRTAALERALLERLRAGSRLTLHLFDDAVYEVVFERFERSGPATRTWTGSLAAPASGSFALVSHDGVVLLSVRDERNGTSFMVWHRPNGVTEIQEIDEGALPGCGNGPAQNNVLPGVPGRAAVPGAAGAGGPTIIDVLVVWTQSAQDAAGGEAAMQTLITMAVTRSNQALTASAVQAQFRLVHSERVDYAESGAIDTDLSRLEGTIDGFMDNVHGLRDEFRADLVSLIANRNPVDACGIAYLLTQLSPGFSSWAFSVVHWNCAVGNLSFAHELGHNLGCGHDRATDLNGLFEFSHGHRFMGTSGTQWRTVMAYAPGTRIGRFSNPGIMFDGAPTGVAAGMPNSAHNAGTINLSRNLVAGYRTGMVIPAPVVAGPMHAGEWTTTVSGILPFTELVIVYADGHPAGFIMPLGQPNADIFNPFLFEGIRVSATQHTLLGASSHGDFLMVEPGTPPAAPTVVGPIRDGDPTVTVTNLVPNATTAILFANGQPAGYVVPNGQTTVEVPTLYALQGLSVTAVQENPGGISVASTAVLVEP